MVLVFWENYLVLYEGLVELWNVFFCKLKDIVYKDEIVIIKERKKESGKWNSYRV